MRGRSRRSSSRMWRVVIVVSPSDTGIRQARAKTDRLDARALAKLLWAGQLDGVWTPMSASARCRRLARRASGAGGARARRTKSTRC